MGRNRTEGTAAETSAMNVDTKLDHVVGRDTFAFIFRMGLARIRQIIRGIQFGGCHRRIGWVHHHELSIHALQQPLGMHHIRLFLDVPEVLGLCSFVFQTFLMRMKHDVCFTDAARDIFFSGEVDGLRDVQKRRVMSEA